MPNFNRVTLIGHLVRDSELKFSADGKAIYKNCLAVSEKYGEKENTVFVDFVCFGKTAEFIGQYSSKGQPVLIDGKLQQEQWEEKETGKKKSKISIIANQVQIFQKRERHDESGKSEVVEVNSIDDVLDDDIPF